MNDKNNNRIAPLKPVKNRFINEDLLKSAKINEVGTQSASNVSNYKIEVLDENPVVKENRFTEIFSQNQIEDVNAKVYKTNASDPPKGNFVSGNNLISSSNNFQSLDKSFSSQNQQPNRFINPEEILHKEEPSETLNLQVNNGIQENSIPENENKLQNSEVLTMELPKENEYVNPQETVETLEPQTESQISVPQISQTDPLSIFNGPNMEPAYNNNGETLNNIGIAAPKIDQTANIPNESLNQIDNNQLLNNQPIYDASTLNNQPLDVNTIEKTTAPGENEIKGQSNYDGFEQTPPPVKEVKEKPNMINEVALVKSYIGPKYPNYLKSVFSVPAFFLGSFYMFTKKLYITGILIFIIEILTLYFLKEKLLYAGIAFLGFAVLKGLITNPLYIKLAKLKCKKVLKKRPNLSQGDLNSLCEKKGKRNMPLSVIINTILLFLAGFLAYKYIGVDYFKKIYENTNEVIEENAKIKYEGELKYNGIDVEEYFYINLPKEYERQDKNLFSFEYQTNNEGKNSKCQVIFGGISGYEDQDDLVDQIGDYHKIPGNPDIIKSNDITWNQMIIKDKNSKIYHRFTTVDNKIFALTFKEGLNNNNNICNEKMIEILSTVELKEKWKK